MSEMNPQIGTEVFAGLQDSTLFQGLSAQDLGDLIRHSTINAYQPGEVIIEEGSIGGVLYLVIDGAVEVVRKDAQTDDEYRIAVLQRGAEIGERSLLSDARRSATVRSLTEAHLLAINVTQLAEERDLHGWLDLLKDNLLDSMARRVEQTNEGLIDALRREVAESTRRVTMGRFLVYLLAAISIYTFSLPFLTLITNVTVLDIISNGLIVMWAGTVVLIMRSSPYPLSFYGLHLPADWREDVGETVAYTLGMVVAVTILRAILVQTVPSLAGEPLLYTPWQHPEQFSLIFIGAYFILAPLQEIATRGALQTLLAEFLEGLRGKVLLAILISNLAFAVAHSHFSPAVAVASFLPGLAWGVLYQRQQHLVGVTISHIFVGLYALLVTDFFNILLPA